MSGEPNRPSTQQDEAPATARRDRARLVAGLILAAVGLAFALVNLRNVKVDWIVGSAHSPLILVIALSVLIGAGIDRIVVSRSRSGASRLTPSPDKASVPRAWRAARPNAFPRRLATPAGVSAHASPARPHEC